MRESRCNSTTNRIHLVVGTRFSIQYSFFFQFFIQFLFDLMLDITMSMIQAPKPPLAHSSICTHANYYFISIFHLILFYTFFFSLFPVFFCFHSARSFCVWVFDENGKKILYYAQKKYPDAADTLSSFLRYSCYSFSIYFFPLWWDRECVWWWWWWCLYSEIAANIFHVFCQKS